VDRIRKTTGIRRVGHGGTLDPFASGLLLLLVGSATRLSEYFLGMDKEYVATVQLGVETSTHDPEGEVVSECDGWRELGEAQLDAALQGLLGPIMQTPPAYSAKKVRGEAAHRRMRRGEAVQLEPVKVHVYDLKVLALEMPSVRLGVRCSSGTYVRALARDLGRSLGVGGHLSALRRVGIGPFPVDSAVDFDSLADPGLIEAELLPPAEALSHFPSLEVGPEDATRILHGQFLSMAGSGIPEETPVRILLNGNLLAVAAREGEMLRPKKVFAHG
jgi:tRNA pseudouridine55 synthase